MISGNQMKIEIMVVISLLAAIMLVFSGGCGGGGTGSEGSSSFSSNTSAMTVPTVTPTVQTTATPQVTPQPTGTQHPNQPVWLSRTNGVKYHLTQKMDLTYANGIKKISCIIPIPRSLQYQDMGTASYYDSPGGTSGVDNSVKILVTPNNDCEQSTLQISKTKDFYSRFLMIEASPSSTGTKSYSFTIESDITIYSLAVDFSRITTIYPYNKDTEQYTLNTGREGDGKGYFLDPENSVIQSVSSNLWAQSQGDYLQYARLCYDWVSSSSNFTYGNPGQGFKYIDDLMSSRTGDCGNLSSVYISLLRCQGIPAHHLVLVNPQRNGVHAYAEFYLENYGWIPVDVTYKLVNPSGDYFGKVNSNDTGMIVSNGLNLGIDHGLGNGVSSRITSLQLYVYYLVPDSSSANYQNPVLNYSVSATKL